MIIVMILTYKVKHGRDFTQELQKAKLVAKYALEHRGKLSSKDVKQFGLKSAISNQILRKYGKNYSAKKVKNVKLTIPGQSVQLMDAMHGVFYISCLDLYLTLDKMNQLKHVSQVNHMYHLLNLNPFKKYYKRVAQVEIDDTYAYIACEVEPLSLSTPQHTVGVYSVDTPKGKTAGMTVTVACTNGKVIRGFIPYRCRYVNRAKQKDYLHKLSRRIVNFASANRASIVVEDKNFAGRPKGSTLKNLSNWKESNRHNNFKEVFQSLNTMIEYKANLSGVGFSSTFVPDGWTSLCSKCHEVRSNGVCPKCGNAEPYNTNAAFLLTWYN